MHHFSHECCTDRGDRKADQVRKGKGLSQRNESLRRFETKWPLWHKNALTREVVP
jgi:trehalose-6-phosphate synthase